MPYDHDVTLPEHVNVSIFKMSSQWTLCFLSSYITVNQCWPFPFHITHGRFPFGGRSVQIQSSMYPSEDNSD